MALIYTFAPGASQAEAAGDYFMGLANDLADEALDNMVPKQLILQEPEGSNLNIRLWALPGRVIPVRRMLGWIRQIMRQMEDLARPHGKPMSHMPTLMTSPEPEATCFIEVLGRRCFTPFEEHLLTIGLRQGRTNLLSSPKVMMVRLEEELAGLAIHGRGSWLIEGRTTLLEQMEVFRR